MKKDWRIILAMDIIMLGLVMLITPFVIEPLLIRWGLSLDAVFPISIIAWLVEIEIFKKTL